MKKKHTWKAIIAACLLLFVFGPGAALADKYWADADKTNTDGSVETVKSCHGSISDDKDLSDAKKKELAEFCLKMLRGHGLDRDFKGDLKCTFYFQVRTGEDKEEDERKSITAKVDGDEIFDVQWVP